MRDVKGFLGNKQREEGPLASEWAALEELHDKRLWHQLTLALVEFVKNDYFVENKGLLEMYDNFLADFEHRINPLTLMEITLYIVKEYSDPDKAVEFLEKQREKVKNVLEADILCLTAIGNIRLEEKKMDETKTVIAQAREMLDTIDGVSAVHNRFYDLCSKFHKISGNYNDYYRDALRYLGCIDLNQLSDTEKVERALHLSLAALLGSNVYNFGELLAHQVLAAIKGTEHNWIVELLYAFNSGNLSKFESLRPQWEKQPDMVKNHVALQQKICLLCLMELTFNRPSNDRNLTFSTIANEAQIPENEVELLVMKALSLGLVKGWWIDRLPIDDLLKMMFGRVFEEYFTKTRRSIDEVEQVVHMTWVQPRVLDLNQIANMKDRLTEWCDKVKTQVYSVEDEVPELIV